MEALVDGGAVPMQICLAPAVEASAMDLFARGGPLSAQVFRFRNGRPPDIQGPAVLVLSPADLVSPARKTLAALAESFHPGRPVLLGGTRDRQVLMDAINLWKVVQVVPDDCGPSVLIGAINKAYELLLIESGLLRSAEALELETEELAQTLRAVEDAQARLRHAERMATLGRITSSLLPVMTGHLGALDEFSRVVTASRVLRGDLNELCDYAITGIRSLEAMMEEIRAFAEKREEDIRLDPLELDRVVHFAVSFGRFDPLAAKRILETDIQSGARIRGDNFRLYQVLLNLLRNAFQATREGGRIRIITSADDFHARVTVENEGEPIPAHVQQRLFEPFFTTKGAQGMGLGLPMCKSAVERHGGRIDFQSNPGESTKFFVTLPLFHESKTP